MATFSKVLLIRLSSLGDVILASTALEALSASEIHWVISREYAELLQGHPKLSKLWIFDRSNGLEGWLKLCEKLWQEDFTEVIDLHSNLRSKIARAYFFFRSKTSGKTFAAPWRVLDKERLKLQGYFIFRALWPIAWRPSPLVERFSKLAGGSGRDRPNLAHLTARGAASLPDEFLAFAERPYLAIMPSSRWDGKKWPVRKYLSTVLSLGSPVVVLGSQSDRESILLLKLLEQSGHRFFNAVGRFDFSQLAAVLEHSNGYLGNDTGLAHLTEAVGRPVTIVSGPTVAEMGFGPWRPESQSVRAPIWCSPCGKDGRMCFRLNDRFACQRTIEPRVVVRAVQEMVDRA
jgi:ADP-heptose:LPS heptosyltransferase